MANRYTYDDFQKAMQSSGLGGQFSDADLKLAQQNPDAGMSILKYKQDYKNAATDEARALANLGATRDATVYAQKAPPRLPGRSGASIHGWSRNSRTTSARSMPRPARRSPRSC